MSPTAASTSSSPEAARATQALVHALKRLVDRHDLTDDEVAQAFEAITSGHASPSAMAGFLVALRLKGETESEIAAAVRAVRARAVSIQPPWPVLDTCGTGGDGRGTVNISTGAAFVAAAAGVKVLKHGNRAVSSKAGSADVLEALGIVPDLGPAEVLQCLSRLSIGFAFAPTFHAGLRHAAAVRREIGIRTIFNVLGPLCNPAAAAYQLLGVYEERLVDLLAGVLARLGVRSALVVHGLDAGLGARTGAGGGGGGLDEISPCGPTVAARLREGRIVRWTIDPARLGVGPHDPAGLTGGSAAQNAQILRSVLGGDTDAHPAAAAAIALNAAAALVVAQHVPDLPSGLAQVKELLAAGTPLSLVDAVASLSQSLR